jgi:hypothetical protein
MRFFLPLLVPVLASSAILPETIGAFHQTSTSMVKLAEPAIWDEYGLKEAETARYDDGSEKITVTGYRFEDSTGAMAAFQWQRPADAKPSAAGDQAVQTAHGLILAFGSYLLSFPDHIPPAEELTPFLASLHNVDGSPLPTLPGFFPSEGLVPNSQRYVLGPASLAKFDPGISPSVAGFHFGTEAQLGSFRTPKGDMTLAVFNYPNPQIAMQKLGDFEKVPGAVAKRTGPLIAVILSPPDADAAERLLAQVRYDARITLNEHGPGAVENAGNMLLAIVTLAGILIVFCTIAGMFVGGFRTILLGRRKGVDADPMILLHLEQR